MLESFAMPIIKYALSEDIGTGDITTLNAVPSGINARAALVVKEQGVLAGLDVARLTFHEAAPALKFRALASDGDSIAPGVAVAQVLGDIGGILKAERTALNFLQHLSGVATLTRRFVDEIAGTGAVILDTRKTTPGLRFLEKFAVTSGGGQNHRLALWDMYLVKDNHIRAAGGITAAVDRIARTRQGDLLLEVEVESLDQLADALRPEVDRILVDNRTPDEVKRAVDAVDRWCAQHPSDSPRRRAGARRWPEVEVSGGITLKTARAYAETGVDYLSVGALTHSAPALNLSLEIEDVG
jgi:nicotinate-nucleotide pyrophosphorylase (carboxylating)